MDLYYWYYGTLAMKQFGDPEWSQWNVRIRDLLIAEQVHDGEFAGSWEPRDPWSGYGGRIYSTAMATLCLEVYFRFLPLYEQVFTGPAPAEPAAEHTGARRDDRNQRLQGNEGQTRHQRRQVPGPDHRCPGSTR